MWVKNMDDLTTVEGVNRLPIVSYNYASKPSRYGTLTKETCEFLTFDEG